MVTNKKYIYNAARFIRIPYVLDKKKKKKYYGTYYWAIQCGISAKNAQRIAYYSNQVDSLYNPVTSQAWHFNVNWGTNKPDSREIISLVMILVAAECFSEASSYEKDTYKYKKSVKEGLKYLGFALHPIQDLYAHTRDRCELLNMPVPANSANGVTCNNNYIQVWSHVAYKDDTDKAQKRQGQLSKTATRTKEILSVFVKEYPDILT